MMTFNIHKYHLQVEYGPLYSSGQQPSKGEFLWHKRNERMQQTMSNPVDRLAR
jgi:hypothetical protein